MGEVHEACQSVLDSWKRDFKDPIEHAQLGRVAKTLLNEKVIPCKPAEPSHPSMLMICGDCENPAGKSPALTKMLEYLTGKTDQGQCLVINAPGTGKSKALLDILRYHFGILLDLSTTTQDVQWSLAWAGIQKSANNFVTRLEACHNDVALAISSLKRSVTNQTGTVILSRLISLMWLKQQFESKNKTLTPADWLRFQLIERRKDGLFRQLDRIIWQKNIAESMIEDVIKECVGSEPFVIISDEFHVLQQIKQGHPHEQGTEIVVSCVLCLPVCMCVRVCVCVCVCVCL